MKTKSIFIVLALLFLCAQAAFAGKNDGEWSKGASAFGAELGWGRSVDIPPLPAGSGMHRTDWQFAFIEPYYKYNLTGIIGDSFYRGSLFWVNELNLVQAYHPSGGVVIGDSPVMMEYKFWPHADWSPHVRLGGGFSYTDWKNKQYQRELGTNFEFLLHAGGGIDIYKVKGGGTFSINYRFFHISNAGMKMPNIGVNANVVTLGYEF